MIYVHWFIANEFGSDVINSNAVTVRALITGPITISHVISNI